MDKFRALQYFAAAAEGRSFAAAARRLEVSTPSIAKMITSLERRLGAKLFDRAAHGLTLTADGETYLEACEPALEQLAAADEMVSGSAAGLRGTLVIGAPPIIAQHCLFPALPGFHARYPDIQIDIRAINKIAEAEARSADVFIVLGWPTVLDLVRRRLGQLHFVVYAAPSYWAVHGVPQRPKDLERHTCLLFRNPDGSILDLWQFERDNEEESAVVRGWLVSNQRDLILDAVVAGEGVARFTDLTVKRYVDVCAARGPLCVDAVGFNDKTWLDRTGHPHSEELRVVERFRRTGQDAMQVDITMEDAKALTKPWTSQLIFQLRPEWDIMEQVCTDNETFLGFEK